MTPLSMAMASDEEDDDYNSNGTITPNTLTKDGFGEQLLQLQLLVQEMKDGFILAMQELGRIQDGDKELTDRVENSERQNRQMIGDLTNSVQQLKMDLTSALEEVKKNSEVTKSLSEQIHQLQNERTQLLEAIKQGALENERSRYRRTTTHALALRSDSDNNNSDSGKPYSNGDSSRSDWEVTHNVSKRVSPMLQPFIDSLPDGITGNMSPLCDTDSDSSATKAANHMLRMGNTLREKYQSQRQDAIIGSSDSDDLHDILAQLSEGKEGDTLTRKDIEGASANDGKRLQIAQELLSSEKTYISQLSFLKEKIVNPLIAEALMSLSDINMMFPPCLNKLYQKHSSLLGTLETRLSHWKYQGMLGDIFARLTSSDGGEFLQLYSKYIQSFSASLSALSKQINKSSTFQTFLKKQLSECSKEESDLTIYLMAPIQRIPSYVLCLKKLLKSTSPTHPDYFHVDTCLKELSEFITTVNVLVDKPVVARKASYSSQSSTEMSSSKKSISKDSGVHSLDEFGHTCSLAALQRTWYECLSTGKSSKSCRSSKTTSSCSKSEQKDIANKGKSNKSDRTTHKPRTKAKSRPKLRSPSPVMTSPPWAYDPQFMYNQQIGMSAYGMHGPSQPIQPMLANGPAYIYGHPGPHMMPHDADMMAAVHPSQRPPSRTGAPHIQPMLGVGFDPRLYGQIHPASEGTTEHGLSQSELKHFITEDEDEGEQQSHIPSTPLESVSHSKQMKNHGNQKSHRTRLHKEREERHPVHEEMRPNSAPNTARSESPSRTKFLHRSQTSRDPQGETKTRGPLEKRKTIASVSPDLSGPVSLTSVQNDGAQTEVDRLAVRRKSVPCNRKAVLQGLKEMEETMSKKNSITSSIMFQRRNLTDAPIDEDLSEPLIDSESNCTADVCHTAPHSTEALISGPIQMVDSQTCYAEESATFSSRVEEIPSGDNMSSQLMKRRSSAGAALGFSFDENGDPCSAV